jgi:two-component system CheB/CheR fusion protein
MSTGALRVLVVEDNVDAAEMMSELLCAEGHLVRVAHDGPGAIRAAAEFQPGVVLLDIGLPGMDGYEVADKMRQMPELAGTLLVALTGHSQAADKSRALTAGFQRHLVKPLDWDALRGLLEGVET